MITTFAILPQEVKNLNKIFSDDDIQYMKENFATKSYKEIATKLGFTERQIRSKLNNMGFKKLRSFNKRYFKTVDSPSKAYWLGFLYADGYIVDNSKTRNYELGIELDYKDRYILEALSNELGNVHKIINRSRTKEYNGYVFTTNTSVIRIYSKEIVKDLERLGVVQNKTNSVIYPNYNEKYFFDFLRGYLDGDGCISINKRGNLLVSFTCSNREFLKTIQNIILKKLSIAGNIYKENDKKFKLMYFRKSDIPKLLSKIYYDPTSIMLLRKYNIYAKCYLKCSKAS